MIDDHGCYMCTYIVVFRPFKRKVLKKQIFLYMTKVVPIFLIRDKRAGLRILIIFDH